MYSQQPGQIALQEHAPLSTWNVNQQQLQLQQPLGAWNPDEQLQSQLQQPQGHVYYPGEIDENEDHMQFDQRSMASGSQANIPWDQRSLGQRSVASSQADLRSLASISRYEQHNKKLGVATIVSRFIGNLSNNVRSAAHTWAELDNKQGALSTHEQIAKLQEKRDFARQNELRKRERMRSLVIESLGGPRTEMENLPSGLTLELQRSQIAPHPRDRGELIPVAKIRSRPRLYELQNVLRSQLLRPESATSQAESHASSRHGSKSMSVYSDMTSISRQWRPEPLSDIDGRSSSKTSRTTMGSRRASSVAAMSMAGSKASPMSPTSPTSTFQRWNTKDANIMRRASTAHTLRVS
eukprot:TRINITY_DN29240_c0_g1_i1.p1 TRINITY_DN29240_c0_g1~~TRINITY_DN29240_c0_g1_i1.p1  ORF type:complete len:352 (+),score=53.32 TRINITY_DN29240_c0_g1_i1:71-1126(+)